MTKAITKSYDKLWGRELWLYSSLPGKQIVFEDGTKCEKGPIVRVIVSKDPLPIQVHPASSLNDDSASEGKGWYIVKSQKESFVISGMKDYSEKTIRKLFIEKKFETNLIKLPVVKDKFYFVRPGHVHGLGPNLEVLEIQKETDKTFRYYDYDRLENGSPRQLAIEESIKNQRILSSIEANDLKEPKNESVERYRTAWGTVCFGSGSFSAPENGFIVNLTNYDSFKVNIHESTNFPKFAFFTFS